MTDPPRRKRFQFHLSTAIVMMFVAGGLMWANVVVRNPGFVETSDGRKYFDYSYGWPFPAYFWNLFWDVHNPRRYTSSMALVFDIAAVLVTLLIAFLFCELLVRCSARKGV